MYTCACAKLIGQIMMAVIDFHEHKNVIKIHKWLVYINICINIYSYVYIY